VTRDYQEASTCKQGTTRSQRPCYQQAITERKSRSLGPQNMTSSRPQQNLGAACARETADAIDQSHFRGALKNKQENLVLVQHGRNIPHGRVLQAQSKQTRTILYMTDNELIDMSSNRSCRSTELIQISVSVQREQSREQPAAPHNIVKPCWMKATMPEKRRKTRQSCSNCNKAIG
jgi:hypothetical protein